MTAWQPEIYIVETLEQCKELCCQGIGVFIFCFVGFLVICYYERVKNPPKILYAKHLRSLIIRQRVKVTRASFTQQTIIVAIQKVSRLRKRFITGTMTKKTSQMKIDQP